MLHFVVESPENREARETENAATEGVTLARQIRAGAPELALRAGVKKPETSSGFWNWWRKWEPEWRIPCEGCAMKKIGFNNAPAGNSVASSAPRVSNEHERRLVELCPATIQEAVDTLKTSLEGLTHKEADRRLDKFGPNELTHLKRLGFWADMSHRFRSPLVIQLLVIASVSAVIGELKSTVIVGAMVLLSVGLSYILDRRSGQAVENLGKRVQSRTLVLRDGVESEIRIAEIVPGDVVLLQAGSIIPADLRLIVAKDFFVSQSALTGEPIPVGKGGHDTRPHRFGPGFAERLFFRHLGHQRHGPGTRHQHRHPHLIRSHFGKAGRKA